MFIDKIYKQASKEASHVHIYRQSQCTLRLRAEALAPDRSQPQETRRQIPGIFHSIPDARRPDRPRTHLRPRGPYHRRVGRRRNDQ